MFFDLALKLPNNSCFLVSSTTPIPICFVMCVFLKVEECTLSMCQKDFCWLSELKLSWNLIRVKRLILFKRFKTISSFSSHLISTISRLYNNHHDHEFKDFILVVYKLVKYSRSIATTLLSQMSSSYFVQY